MFRRTRDFYSAAELLVCLLDLIQLFIFGRRTDEISFLWVYLKGFLKIFGRHVETRRERKEGGGGGKKGKRKIKSSEDKKTRGRTEPSPDGESSASKVSFFFSPKRGGERRRGGPMMEGWGAEEKLSALRPHRTGRQNPKTPRVFLQAADDITAGGWGLAI